MKNCMLVDCSAVASSAQFVPDEVSAEVSSCSWRAKTQVNGYNALIALQKWRLEKGHFIQQMDESNCRPIACLKIMDLFHLASSNDVQQLCKTINIPNFVMAE